MLIKIIFVIFIIFVLFRVFYKIIKKQISKKEAILWTLFWLFVGIATIFQNITNFLAQFMGVGRGLDLVLPISVAVIFYILFKLIVKIDRVQHDITKIIRKIAINTKDDKE